MDAELARAAATEGKLEYVENKFAMFTPRAGITCYGCVYYGHAYYSMAMLTMAMLSMAMLTMARRGPSTKRSVP